MTVEMFVKKMNENSPDDSYFRHFEILERERVLANHRLIARRKRKIYDDPLLDFIDRFDKGNLPIDFPFYIQDEIFEVENYYIVGTVNSNDFVALDKCKNHIVQIDDYNNNRIIYECAKTSVHFLKALLMYYKPVNFDDNNYQEHYRNLAKKCAIEAGSEKYFDFYFYSALYQSDDE